MQIDADFQTFAQALTPTVKWEANKISEDKLATRVWYQRKPTNFDLFISGSSGLTTVMYDVEIASLDIDTTEATADTVRTGLHGYRGTVGTSTTLGMFVEDVEEDYIPKTFDADEGFHVAAFSVKIIM